MFRIRPTFLLILILTLPLAAQDTYDTIIRNGKIIDGSGIRGFSPMLASAAIASFASAIFQRPERPAWSMLRISW